MKPRHYSKISLLFLKNFSDIFSLNRFSRMPTTLSDAVKRLSSLVEWKRSDIYFLPSRKTLYSVSNTPSLGRFLNLNERVEQYLDKAPSSGRHLWLARGGQVLGPPSEDKWKRCHSLTGP